MPENIADTTVDEVLGDSPKETTTETPDTTATPAKQTEVSKTERELALEKELSRVRAAQSAADKRAIAAEQKARQLDETTKKAQFGDDEKSYWQQKAVEAERERAELQLKVEVNNLLIEHQNLPEAVKEAVRSNPIGFIGDAQDVPTAVLNISQYLGKVESKVTPATPEKEDEPKTTGKEFPIPGQSARVKDPVTKPKNLGDAVQKLIDGGIFS
jgi:hypothetical protein